MTPPPIGADVAAAYRGSRALVLGGTGFIGRWVARLLTESQATLMVAVRDPAAFARIATAWSISAEVMSFTALDEASVMRLIRDAAPDIVFNLVGYGVDRDETQPDLMWRINRDLVRQAALATAHSSHARTWSHGKRFIHVGSALEYGLVEGVATEDGATEPHTPYGRSKLGGTVALRDVARTTGLRAVTARAFTVFGPGEHQGRLLPTLRRAAMSGSTVRLSAGSQQRDFCYVEDVAEGLLRLGLAALAPGEVVNLATGRMIRVREFAETAARILGLPEDRLQFGAEPIREDEMRISGVDVRRLEACTEWTPPSVLEESLRRAADFEERLAGHSFTMEGEG
jgi:nucleoside-diphosphate-sugar epimerase